MQVREKGTRTPRLLDLRLSRQLYDEEDDESHNDESDYGYQEVADEEFLLVEGLHQRAEVSHAAERDSYEQENQVFDQSLDEGTQVDAQDEGDCESENFVRREERLELLSDSFWWWRRCRCG